MGTKNMLLLGLLGACLGAAGCRSAPPAVVEEPVEQGMVEGTKMDAADLDKQVAQAAMRMSKVERNGVVYYCRKLRQIGTNIAKLQCMTEAQLRVEVETMAQVRDDMRNKMGKCTAGRTGNGGPCGAW